MRILHTSDWHLGRLLYNQRRDAEFSAFLAWLLQTLVAQKIEVLLVAGDVFDTTTPPHSAQSLYYEFLHQVAQSPCRHVVIIGGNHDSPTFLEAPQALLRSLNVHVVATVGASPQEEVLVLKNKAGQAELIVAAVPYLRESDVRQVHGDESPQAKAQQVIQGVQAHYARVASIAESERQRLSTVVPVVAMGHLFAAGGHTLDDDGVRDLYVGGLGQVSATVFPDTFDYVALGHLHVPQRVQQQHHIRYSGSPIPMGFGEANQQKIVHIVEFSGRAPSVETIPIPVFQRLQRIQGDWSQIQQALQDLVASNASVWLEVVYEGEDVLPDLRVAIEEVVAGSQLKILRIKNNRVAEQILQAVQAQETLEDLDEYEVFDRCLQAHEVPKTQQVRLRQLYRETLSALLEADSQA